jgi:hypothetical protein
MTAHSGVLGVCLQPCVAQPLNPFPLLCTTPWMQPAGYPNGAWHPLLLLVILDDVGVERGDLERLAAKFLEAPYVPQRTQCYEPFRILKGEHDVSRSSRSFVARLSLPGRILQEGVPATSLTSLLRKGIPGVSIPVLAVNALLRRLQVRALAWQ